VARLPNQGGIVLAGFGPSRTLAVRGPNLNLQLWDLNHKEPAMLFVEKDVTNWTFHPDGQTLALLHNSRSISIYHTATGKLSHRLPVQALYHLRFHPSEPFLACFEYTNPVVRILNWKTGALVTSVTPAWSPSWIGCGDWSPDGRTLLVPQAEGGLIKEYAFDPAYGQLRERRTLEAPYQGDPVVTFNATGDRFVTRGWSGTIHMFDAISGRSLFQIPGVYGIWNFKYRLQFDRTGLRLGTVRIGQQGERIGAFAFAPCFEYRSVAPTGTADHLRRPAIHPDGRLVAIGRKDGVSLVDVETARELAYLSLPGNNSFVCFDGTGNLLANGYRGFFRWSVRPDPLDPARLTVGPLEVLPFHKGRYPIAASRDGGVIAQSMFLGYGMERHAGGWILHPNSATPRCVDPGSKMGATSVSPDGRLVAFIRDEQSGVSVYSAASGERIWQSPGGQQKSCMFSPDGRWLLTSEDGGRSYAVDTWKPGPQLGPGLVCDATSDLALLGNKSGIYRLVELATGRELARLEDPDQNQGPAVFSPDAAWVVSEGPLGLRVWDLRRIREGLVKLGLDWDAPPFPKALDLGKKPPLVVKVDQENIDIYVNTATVIHKLRLKGDPAGAVAAIQKALTAAPEDPELNNALAWMLVIAADPKARDAKRAVALAQKAIKAWPNRWEPWRTLGLAHHFDGNNQNAVEALRKSLAFRRSGDASDYFPLAAAHQQLGNKEAREWYDRGVAWARDNTPMFASEMAVLRADAETALGIGKQAKPDPLKPPAEK
jgi:WD40 repeat protein/Flp pilus assembly protein TadD